MPGIARTHIHLAEDAAIDFRFGAAQLAPLEHPLVGSIHHRNIAHMRTLTTFCVNWKRGASFIIISEIC